MGDKAAGLGGAGKYQVEQVLAPDQQLWLDLGRLIRDRVLDKDGNVLPADLTSGTYQFRDLTDRAVGNIFEGKVITDKTNGHAAYGCMICCGYPSRGFIWTDPLDVLKSSYAPQDVGGVNSCSGNQDSIGFAYPNWSTGNTAIATANPAEQINALRHTFLTRLGESGCDPWTLARLAGHSGIAISSRYVHPSEQATAKASESIAIEGRYKSETNQVSNSLRRAAQSDGSADCEGSEWRARRDSNSRPIAPEAIALSS